MRFLKYHAIPVIIFTVTSFAPRAPGPLHGQDKRIDPLPPNYISSGLQQVFIPAPALADACRNSRVRGAVQIHISKWRRGTQAREIARGLREFRALARCTPAARYLSVTGIPAKKDCKGVLTELAAFNRSYGATLRRLFPRTAVFYDAGPMCYPNRVPRGYITPRIGGSLPMYNSIFTAKPAKSCPRDVRDSTYISVPMVKMESDPKNWSPQRKRVARLTVFRKLKRLVALKHCPRLRLLIIEIPVGIYLGRGRAYGDRDYLANERGFRKRYDSWLKRKLPGTVYMITHGAW